MWTISRRAILQGVTATGLAYGASKLTIGCDNEPIVPLAPDRPVETGTLRFDLSAFRPEFDHRFDLGAASYPLVRSDAVEGATHLLEHARLPADAAQSFSVSCGLPGSQLRSVSVAGIHLPAVAVAAASAMKGSSFGYLRFLNGGIGPRAGDGGFDITSASNFDAITNEMQAARYLVFHHPDILALEPVAAAVILHHVDSLVTEPQRRIAERRDSLSLLANVIRRLNVALRPDEDPTAEGWAKGQWNLTYAGDKIPIKDANGANVLEDGKVLYEWHYKPHDLVIAALQPVVQEALNKIRDDKDLENKRFYSGSSRASVSDALPGEPFVTRTMDSPKAPSPYAWAPLAEQYEAGQVVHNLSSSAAAPRTVTFTVSNTYNRYLSVYLAYLDGNGKPLKRSLIGAESGPAAYGSDKFGLFVPSLRDFRWDDEFITFAGVVGPPQSIFGIPLPPNDVVRMDFTAKIPDQCVRLAIVTGAMSIDSGDLRDEYVKATVLPTILTSTIEYALPSVLLGIGAVTSGFDTTPLKIEMAEAVLKVTALTFLPVLGGGSFEWRKYGTSLTTSALKLVIAAGGSGALLTAAFGAFGYSLKAIPIIGWALFAVQAADTLQSAIRTTVDISRSRKALVTEVTSTNAVILHIKPKDLTGFPKTTATWSASIIADGGNTTFLTGTLDPTTMSTIDVTFPRVATGGNTQFRFDVISKNGWVAGSCFGFFQNLVSAGATAVHVSADLVSNPVPITDQTKYSPLERLAVSPTGEHVWLRDSAIPPPGSAIACAGGLEAICEPVAITVSHNGDIAQLGYAWQGSQKAVGLCDQSAVVAGTAAYSMQNLNLERRKGGPDATLKNLGCGLIQPVIPIYSLLTPRAYVLEASNNVYNLRQVVLDTSASADFRLGSSLGTFTSLRIVSAAVHKGNVLMAVSGDADTLEYLKVGGGGFTLAGATRRASQAAGTGSLPGHIRGAVSICAHTLDAFLVLEDGNKRIQAFGTTGYPIKNFFESPGVPGASPFITLDPQRQYLDISLEFYSGTIYVLSTANGGRTSADFRLDIFDRKKGKIASTEGFAAARLALDANQNIYALGWNVLDFKGRKEPGVFTWIPTTPGGV